MVTIGGPQVRAAQTASSHIQAGSSCREPGRSSTQRRSAAPRLERWLRAITNEMRLEIARQLLEDTEVPVGQIAAALGYSEASAFSRAFRR
jgi:AraC-like DNA-binding protein